MKPEIIALIKTLNKIFQEQHLTYFLIGATARDLHLAADKGIPNLRKTEDVDIAVLMASESDFNTLKNLLIATGEFTEGKGQNPIKLYYKGTTELDILPFGGIENENRELRLSTPTTFVMDVPGFTELLPFVQELELEHGGVKVKSTSLEGIVLLKLFAYHAQPERTKDIADIDTIIRYYFDLSSDGIYESDNDVLDLYGVKDLSYKALVGAHVIGRKLSKILDASPELKEKTRHILAKRPTETWLAMLAGFEKHQ